MARFREFVNQHPVSFRLREDEAAPSAGGDAAQPPNPDNTTNKHVGQVMGREFGIRPEDFEAALESDAITLYGTKIPAFDWEFKVAGNIHVSVEARDDGETYNVTFPLEMLYNDNPELFIHRWSTDKAPLSWDGHVEDKTEVMNKEQLMTAWVAPWQSAPPGGAMGGMGGMDPMAGGMPPGGAPPGGAPPMM